MNKYSSYILYLLLSILVVILYANDFGPVESMQKSVNDTLCRLTAKSDIHPNVALVEIDDTSQKEYGEWPWNRDIIADLVAATAAGEPKVIVLNMDLSEDAFQDSAGYTGILAGQLSWINHVVIPYDIALATYRSKKTNNPEYLFNYSVNVDNPLGIMKEQSSLQVRKVFLPATKLLESKAMLGFDYIMPDDDRIIRHQPLIMNYEGFYYPSISLIAAAAFYDVSTDNIEVHEQKDITLGSVCTIPINDASELFINFSKPNSFQKFSAADVLTDEFDRSQFAGKVILIDATDPLSGELYKTAVSDRVTKSIVQATVLENIINKNFIFLRNNQPIGDMLLLLALGAICAFVMPQLKLKARLMYLFLGFVILGGVNYYFASYLHILPESAYFALELLLFLVAAVMMESQLLAGATESEENHGRNKLPKVKLSKKKQNESAVFNEPSREEDVPVREIPPGDEEIPTTALGSDSQIPVDHQDISRQIDIDATSAATEAKNDVDETAVLGNESSLISQPEIISPDYDADNEDKQEEIVAEDELDETTQAPYLNDSGSQASSQPTHLGRYQVTGPLGKGAMGMVYKGIDPAINRPVALKTIRLDFVNDPEEFEELKERLFREAQAAGKLSHPNIVTIYDVGSEGHLQYIAMEYLEGQTLEDMIKKKVKFNYRIIAQIIVQICNALQYAHEQGIVHRDIKPANIMVLKDYRVKVMDYGIARIDSNSMTKTGIAMGTPNYISPEQLKGRKSDHRADLFSLGVVMYEMLLGKRPFKGENITSLIYAIINNEPEKPSSINPQIPLLFDHIIGKALQKDPAQRYQRASEIAADMADFVESFASS